MDKTHRTRGAALIIVVALLTILMALALAFFTASRTEMRLATNRRDLAQAQHLTDAGLSIAQAFLQQDKILHPTFTSIDHAWRTYFNGAWYAGKTWAFNETPYWRDPGNGDPLAAGIPKVDASELEYLDRHEDLYIPRENTGTIPPNRAVLAANLDNFPYVTAEGSYARQVNNWADVDLDGDGLRDAMWIPIAGDSPADYLGNRFTADGIDNDLDGYIDENPLMGEDGIDNTGDGNVDNANEQYLQSLWPYLPDGIDNDGNGVIDNDEETDPEAVTTVATNIPQTPERGVFVYIAENPDGELGTGDEVLRLTAPIYYLQHDATGNPERVYINALNIAGQTLDARPNSTDVDPRDNDYSLIANYSEGAGFQLPDDYGQPAGLNDQRRKDVRDLVADGLARSYHIIHPQYVGASYPYQAGDTVASSTGEPVSDVVGRVAVLITDTAAQVNLNTGGALATREFSSPFGTFANTLTLASSQGLSPMEYDFRVLPSIGDDLTAQFAGFRTGAIPDAESNRNLWPYGLRAGQVPFDYDRMLPGYGFTDDTGTAFTMAFDGLDNDGDAPLYQSDEIDNDLNAVQVMRDLNAIDPGAYSQDDIDHMAGLVFALETSGDATDYDALVTYREGLDVDPRTGLPVGVDDPGEGERVGIDEGLVPYDYTGDGRRSFAQLEGVDDPGELLAFRPFRNRIAESNGIDDDDDGMIDEIGELGDTFFPTRDAAILISGIGLNIMEGLERLVTVHSRERNTRYQFIDRNIDPDHFDVLPGGEGRLKIPRLSGLKLDYNYAEAEHIANSLVHDWSFAPSYPAPRNTGNQGPARLYMSGLRLGDSGMATFDTGAAGNAGNVTPNAQVFQADDEMRAYQIGTSIVDGRDADHTRTTASFLANDEWADLQGYGNRRIRFTVAGAENIRINELMVRPTRRVEAESAAPKLLPGTGLVNAIPELVDTTLPFVSSTGPVDFLFPMVGSGALTPSIPANQGQVDNLFNNFRTDYFKSGVMATATGRPDFDMGRRVIPTGDVIMAKNGEGQFGGLSATGEPTSGTATVVPIDPGYDVSNANWSGTVWTSFTDTGSDVFEGTLATLYGYLGIPQEPAAQVLGRSYKYDYLNPTIVYDAFGNPDYLNDNASIGIGDALSNPAPHAGAASGVGFQSIRVVPGQGPQVLRVSSMLVADNGLDFSGINNIHEVPNVVQFRFGPSPQLPPGRYYLMANTTIDGNAASATVRGDRTYTTVTNPSTGEVTTNSRLTTHDDKLQYIMKYGTAEEDIVSDFLGDNGWFLDVFDGRNAYNVSGLDRVKADDSGISLVHRGQDERGPIVGTRINANNDEIATGWVLMPSYVGQFDPGDSRLNAYCNRPEFNACTVVIPPYAADPADQEYLYVAVWKSEANKYAGPPALTGTETALDYQDKYFQPDLNINWFEFSQEPDHEWVEVVNVAPDGDPVDIGGWQLEVGAAGVSPIQREPDDHRLFTVPTGTRVAPGGKVLLAVNKYDAGAGTFGTPGGGKLLQNGIGLAATNDENFLPMFGVTPNMAGSITVPPLPTPDPRPIGMINWPVGTVPLAEMDAFMDSGDLRLGNHVPSVFFRAFDLTEGDDGRSTMIDFVDYKGDGYQDGLIRSSGDTVNPLADVRSDDRVLSTRPEEEYNIGTGEIRDDGQRPWDRIVQLRAVGGGGLFDADDSRAAWTIFRDSLAPVILRGGYLPNYPEEDCIDNDNDNATLATDGINNTLYGLVDAIDEGIDEGRLALERRRRFYNGVSGFPLYPVPGGFHAQEIPNLPEAESTAPLAWRNFVERRYYPGDAVFVTLYEGLAATGRVADRVTYTQKDVENRSIDDGIHCPYTFEPAYGGVFAALDPRHTQTREFQESVIGNSNLVSQQRSLWPDNTAGVDFYRSLERKHPLYAGDRFGTSNRWEATDGNYDDWDAGQGPLYTADITSGGNLRLVPWDNGLAIAPASGERRAYAHAVGGSPLRDNFFTRALEEPYPGEIDHLGSNEQNRAKVFHNDTAPGSQMDEQRPAGIGRDPDALPNWMFDRGRQRNAAYASPGDLLTIPHLTLADFLAPASAAGGNTFLRRSIVKQALVGRDPSRSVPDVEPLLETGMQADIMLTAGQADFYPTWPPDDIDPDLMRWNLDPLTNPAYPRAWAPVFLFDLGDELPSGFTFGQPIPRDLDPTGGNPVGENPGAPDVFPFQWMFMMREPVAADLFAPIDRLPLGFLSLNDTGDPSAYYRTLRTERWPLWRGARMPRASFFAAANIDDFDPTVETPDYDDPAIDSDAPYGAGDVRNPAEALFVWDGDDGLEDGTYDLYIVTAENVKDLAKFGHKATVPDGSETQRDLEEGRVLEAHNPFTLEGRVLIDALTDIAPSDLGINLEVFTDVDGNQRCWEGSERPSTASLLNKRDTESFGPMTAVQPATGGAVYYGQVEVVNQYLAVRVRNWARGGKPNRFSHVVLAPRQRDTGRININTATAGLATDDGDTGIFSPLMGVPGLLAGFTQDAEGRTSPVFPGNFADIGLPNVDNNDQMIEPALNSDTYFAYRAALLSMGIEATRPDRIDGRYYTSPGELLTVGVVDVESGDLRPVSDPSMTSPDRLVFDSLAADPEETDPRLAHEEKLFRYARMANLITTRSDVFDITVLAQSGYAEDLNGNGEINWRNEFTINGERKTRTVYRR